MNCKNCNSLIENDSKFCVSCGAKVDNQVSYQPTVKQTPTKKASPLTAVVSVVFFLLAYGVVRYLTQQVTTPSTSTYTPAQLATEAVRQVKTGVTLPQKVDDATTWIDVTAEGDAIRYHYTLTGLDTSQMSNQYLKNYLLSGVCSNNDTKSLLMKDINMEYSYKVSGVSQPYFVRITRYDCSL